MTKLTSEMGAILHRFKQECELEGVDYDDALFMAAAQAAEHNNAAKENLTSLNRLRHIVKSLMDEVEQLKAAYAKYKKHAQAALYSGPISHPDIHPAQQTMHGKAVYALDVVNVEMTRQPMQIAPQRSAQMFSAGPMEVTLHLRNGDVFTFTQVTP